MQPRKSFLRGAIILTAAGVISRTLGAIYRIPLARLLGGEGMGLYQMAYPIYTTILALATAGIPVAISILVARKETLGLHGDSRRIFRVSFLFLSVICLILSISVFQSADFLARVILNQPKAALAIKAIAPAIFFAAVLSVFRGYFQGHQWMVPTAVSQVVEQIFRITAVLVLAFMLFPRGLDYAAAGATFGAVVGAVMGVMVLIYFYARFSRAQAQDEPIARSQESSWSLAKQVFLLAIPVSLGAMVVPLVQVLDAAIVPSRLIQSGFSVARATELYGELSGMASVLINLPTIFAIAMATSLVPAVAEALAQNNHRALDEKINNGLHMTLIIALPAAFGLAILAHQICDLLFAVPEAGIPLSYLAFSVIVICVFQVTSSGLQGIGLPEIPLRHLLITGLLKIFFNYYLTGIVFFNIKGPAIGTTLAFLAGSGLNMAELVKRTGVRYQWLRWLKILVVTLVMTAVVHVSYHAMVSADLNSHLATLAAILNGMGVYGIALLAVGEFDVKMIKRLLRMK